MMLALMMTLLLGFQTSVGAAASYNASDVIGQQDFTSNTANFKTTGLDSPGGTALDTSHHRLFVSDTQNNRVLVYDLDTNNNPTSQIADAVLGQPDLDSNGSALTQTGLQLPSIIAYDAVHDRLFVTDSNNSRVLVYNLSGGVSDGMPASNVLGQTNFTSSGGAASQTILNNPRAVSYDSALDRLFVSDGANRLLVYNLSGGVSDGMPASNVLGQTNFTNNNCNQNAGVVPPAANTLCSVWGSAYDSVHKYLFVSDAQNDRIVVYDLSGGVSNNMAASFVLGQAGFTTDNCPQNPAAATSLCGTFGLSYDTAHSRLFASDGNNNRVLVYNLSGGISNGMAASNVLGQTNFTGDYCNQSVSSVPPTATTLCSVQDVTYDSVGNRLLVTDAGNSRVLSFDTATITNNMAAGSVLGQPDFTSNSSGLYQPITQGLHQPSGTALDTIHHRLFVADQGNNRILVYNLDANNNLVDKSADYVLGQPDFDSSGLSTTQKSVHIPTGIVYDAVHDRLFVLDYLRLLVFDLSGGITNDMDASYVLGEPDFTTPDCNTGQNGLCTPGNYNGGLAYDPSTDRLFVGDLQRVLVFNVAPAHISNFENADNVLGQPDFDTYGFDTGRNSLGSDFYGQGIAFDQAHQRIFVADGANHRVMVFNVATAQIANGENADNVLGQPDFNTFSCTVSQSSICAAQGVPVGYDPVHQRLFVDNTAGGCSILIFDLSGSVSNGMNASAILGTSDFITAGSCAATQSTFGAGSSKASLAINPTTGQLFFADYDNNRGLVFDFTRITTDALPNPTLGTAYSQTIASANNQGAVSYQLASGALPPGLTLSATTGAISGTPTTSGMFDFTIKVINGLGAAGNISDSKTYHLAIAAGAAAVGSNGGITSATSATIQPSAGSSAAGATTPLAASPAPPAKSLLERVIEATEGLIPLFLPLLLLVLIMRLLWQAERERRQKRQLEAALARDKALTDQAQQFVVLVSHYFTTPVAIIAQGIEAFSAHGSVALGHLRKASQRLSDNINDLVGTLTQTPQSSTAQTITHSMPPVLTRRSIYTSAGWLVPVIGGGIVTALLSGLAIYQHHLTLSSFQIWVYVAAFLLIAQGLVEARRFAALSTANRVAAQQAFDTNQALAHQRAVVLAVGTGETATVVEQTADAIRELPDGKLRQTINGAITQLGYLIERLQLVSRLSDPTLQLPAEPVNLWDSVHAATSQLQPALQAKQIQLENSIDPALHITTNRALFGQVVSSLVDNAVKFAQPGGTVTLSAQRRLGQITLRVDDNGIGIAADKLPSLLQPFSRGVDTYDFNYQGQGLSLYIDQLIMQRLSGSLQLDSELGHGTMAALKLQTG